MAERSGLKPVPDSSSDVASNDAAPIARARISARLVIVLERAFLVAGIVLLGVLIRELGAGAVWGNLRLVGWGFCLIFAQEILAYAANTFGWYRAFPPPPPDIPFHRLLAARIAGDAINAVTPTATVGGEFVRARLLEGQANMTTVWASVAVAKVSQTVGQIAFVVLGLFVVLQDTPLPAGIQRGLFITLLLFSSALLVALLMQRRGMVDAGADVLRRLGLPVPQRLGERWQRLDREISRVYERPVSFPISVASFFVGWTLGALEIYLIMWFLGIPGGWYRALTIEVLSVAVDGLLFFVPAKAGTQEGGKVLIFTLLGLDPAKGLALGLVRRLRDLSWAVVGLLILSRHQLRKRSGHR
jgi:putative membrane protein